MPQNRQFESDISIPDLEDGFNRVKKQIESLLKISQLAFDKKEYNISLGLCIFAYEECFKMQKFLRHILKDEKITGKEWHDITKGSKEERKNAHLVKFEKSYLEAKNFIAQGGQERHANSSRILGQLYDYHDFTTFEEQTKPDPLTLARLTILPKIKNACFYLDWNEGNWNIFTKVSKPERKALAKVLLCITSIGYHQALLDKKFPKLPLTIDSKFKEKYRNDPDFIICNELDKESRMSQFKKSITLAIKVLDRYRDIRN